MKSLCFQSSRRRAFILGVLIAAVIPLHASGQEAGAQPKTPEMKAPHTPEEHFARAAEYERKAKEYRQEADLQKKMLDDQVKALPAKPKSGPEAGWVRNLADTFRIV